MRFLCTDVFCVWERLGDFIDVKKVKFSWRVKVKWILLAFHQFTQSYIEVPMAGMLNWRPMGRMWPLEGFCINIDEKCSKTILKWYNKLSTVTRSNFLIKKSLTCYHLVGLSLTYGNIIVMISAKSTKVDQLKSEQVEFQAL